MFICNGYIIYQTNVHKYNIKKTLKGNQELFNLFLVGVINADQAANYNSLSQLTVTDQ